MEFFEKHKDLNNTQKSLAKAMLISGASEDFVLGAVKGYSNTKSTDNSLNCPRCGSGMQIVTLLNGRTAKYCTSDRVVMPFHSKGK